MRPWLRSRVLYFKARREERVGHFHDWRRIGDEFGGDHLRCRCGKKVYPKAVYMRSVDKSKYAEEVIRSMRPMKVSDEVYAISMLFRA